jgi:TRAP-type C4-dicarboxylate transport system permease small subunit
MGLITKVIEYALIICMSSIIIVLSINVFLRYVFSHPFSWAEEVTVLLLIWVTFLAAAILQKRDEHVSITYIFDILPARVKRIILVFGNLCACVVLTVFLLSSINLMKVQAKTFTPALRLPMTYSALAVFVGLAAMLIYTIDLMIKVIKNKHN